MGKIEILAPCGSMESLFAAVRSGADAVYLGAKDFSARASAENFDIPQLKEAVDYCHINRVKVYLTLNTLVFDSQLQQVAELIKAVAECKIDALIVQNLGVAQLAKKIAPSLPLHASTQMSVHSLGGAKLLYEMGFKRVVLAREMSEKEIREIAENCPIELEVFVHGALCMSVSGQCYFSGMLGSRSGNRGRCAQPCRLPYTVNSKKGYALSLKDNSLINHLNKLQEMGVVSAKIEGRMKRPEYVACSVKACVEMRDFGFVTEKTLENLQGVFSRTGFTDGYFTGKTGYEMFGHRQKEDVLSATTALLSGIRSEYNQERKRVALQGKVLCKLNQGVKLWLSDGENSVEVESEKLWEKAINKPLEEDRIKAQIEKTGGTPYYFNSLEIQIENQGTIPMSALNLLRRQGIEMLNEKVINSKSYEIFDYKLPQLVPYKAKEKKLYVRLPDSNLGEGFKQADLVFIPVFTKAEEVNALVEKGFKIGVEIPRGLFGREEKISAQLKKLMEIGIKDVLCNNLGAVYIAKALGAKIHGGFGLNFVNTLDLLWAESYGFEDTELSFELKLKDIEKLGGKLKRGIISYGFLPLMMVRNCPNKSVNISCKDCKKQGKMQDRLNKTFIFYCDGCTAEVLNCDCLDVRDFTKVSTFLDFEVFRFSVENSVEKVENISDFISKTLNFYPKTHGLYLRGVF